MKSSPTMAIIVNYGVVRLFGYEFDDKQKINEQRP